MIAHVLVGVAFIMLHPQLPIQYKEPIATAFFSHKEDCLLMKGEIEDLINEVERGTIRDGYSMDKKTYRALKCVERRIEQQ